MKLHSSLFRFTALLLVIILLFPQAIYADTAGESAYQAFIKAREASHADRSFRIRGDEKIDFIEISDGRHSTTNAYYHIDGYNLGGVETHLQFESRFKDVQSGRLTSTLDSERTSFLLTPDSVYTKTTKPPSDWVKQDVAAMLPILVSLGAMDIFFMLELLNSDRLPMYEKFMSFGEDEVIRDAECFAIDIKISRAQYKSLVEELTNDIAALLGPAAKGMSAMQRGLIKTFARGMLGGLDASLNYTFYIDKGTLRIMQIEANLDMINPNGSRRPGSVSRIRSESSLRLFDYGQNAIRIVP